MTSDALRQERICIPEGDGPSLHIVPDFRTAREDTGDTNRKTIMDKTDESLLGVMPVSSVQLP
ncbi:hypothetical protein [Methanoregula sp.]|uniref:hypothetical protein n=1 Tax=Methanoregula sp. TaxID=2052170 RepID=UPI002D80E687|nr:hypothetical protein [Methanoregula sp.]